MIDKALRKKLTIFKRQKQILKAAMDIFVQKGYTYTTMPEIAKLCGLAAGTIYIYYPSKRDLFIAVIESLMVTPLVNIFDEKTNNAFPTTLKDTVKNRMESLQGDTMHCLLA